MAVREEKVADKLHFRNRTRTVAAGRRTIPDPHRPPGLDGVGKFMRLGKRQSVRAVEDPSLDIAYRDRLRGIVITAVAELIGVRGLARTPARRRSRSEATAKRALP